MSRCANTEALNAQYRKEEKAEALFDSRDNFDKEVTGFFNLPDGEYLDFDGKMSFYNGVVTFGFTDPSIAEKYNKYVVQIINQLQERVDNWDNWNDLSTPREMDVRWDGGEFTEIEVDCV